MAPASLFQHFDTKKSKKGTFRKWPSREWRHNIGMVKIKTEKRNFSASVAATYRAFAPQFHSPLNFWKVALCHWHD